MEQGIHNVSRLSASFVAQRGWQHHDTPTKLALALCSEVGELADTLAWCDDSVCQEDAALRQNDIAQELADITIILVRYAAIHGISFRDDTHGKDASDTAHTCCDSNTSSTPSLPTPAT
jgi:NTP pyrophosphatase (non-canonical NTP hydrolase)